MTTSTTQPTGTASTNPVANTYGGTAALPTQYSYNSKTGASTPTGYTFSSPVANQSLTTLSSNKSKDILSAQNTTNQFAQGGVSTNPDTGISTTANGAAYTPYTPPTPTTAPANGITNTGGYVGETYYTPGSTLPQDSTGNYMPTTTTSPTADKILQSLNDQKAQSDALTAQMVSNIEAQFATLQNQQEQVNAGNNAATQGALFRSGAAQGDAYSQNTQNYQIKQGVDALADLATKKASAILQAQQAGQTQNFKLQEQINNELTQISQDQAAAGKKLSDQILDAQNKAKEIALQTKKETDITNLYNNGTYDPAQIQKKLSGTEGAPTLKEISDTVALLSGTGGSGTIGEYNLYAAQTKQKGLVPLDYQAYQDQQDAKQAKLDSTKAYNNAYASAAGKGAAEAKLGVVNGTGDTVTNLAQQLVSGNLAPSELSKRATGNASYNAVLKAADDYSMATTGKHFNIATADRDYKFANQPGTQSTLNYLKSLVGTADNEGNVVGGNLDELKTISDQIDRTSFPALNDAKAWAKLATGNVEIAQYQAVATEVADQVAKILQGGTGGGGTSDAKLQQATNLFNTGFSKEQLNGVIDSLKPLLTNRAKSMIGDNAYLNDYASDLGLSNNISPKVQVNNYVKTHPEQVENVAKLYEVPGATDQDILDYINLINK